MALLVTGATGFVMSVLAQALAGGRSDGARLVVLDAAPLDAAARRYFAPVSGRLSVVIADVTQPATWHEALGRQEHHAPSSTAPRSRQYHAVQRPKRSGSRKQKILVGSSTST